MSWQIKDDTIYEIHGNAIAKVSHGIDPLCLRIIKKTPETMELLFEFRDVYEAQKKISKKLFDNLSNLIEENQDYSLRWILNKDGYLIENNNQTLCFLYNKESTEAIFMQFLPEILETIKINTAAFKGTDAKQKPLYESLSRILKKIDNN